MGQFITPPTIPTDVYCRRILIPNSPEWIGTVTGALLPLIYSSEWVQTTGVSPEDAAQRALEMFNLYVNSGNDGECGDMACCGDNLKILRINPDTGNLEQSTDGGTTWNPAAGSLRSVIVNPPPPVGNGVAATKCDAASNVNEQVVQWIAQVSNDFTTSTSLIEFGIAVLEAILAAVFVILSLGALTPLEAIVLPTIGAALAAAWGAGKAAFDAYWTTENKDKVLCAAYCNIGDDGSFTDAQFTAFWQKCNVDLPPSPAKMLFMGFISSSGKEGLNAMAASGLSADSDCSSCGCTPPAVSFYTPSAGWFTMSPTTHSDAFDTYEVVSTVGGGENRVTILGGQTPSTYPGTVCVPIKVEALDSPTYNYRTTFDCAGTASGSHGVPVPDGNYTQVDCTNNPDQPPFTIRFTVYRDPIP